MEQLVPLNKQLQHTARCMSLESNLKHLCGADCPPCPCQLTSACQASGWRSCWRSPSCIAQTLLPPPPPVSVSACLSSGGIIYGCFMPAFQIAANDPFRLLQAPTPPLSVFTTFFYFAVGFTLVSGTLNVWLMYRWAQQLGQGVASLKGGVVVWGQHCVRQQGPSVVSCELAQPADWV